MCVCVCVCVCVSEWNEECRSSVACTCTCSLLQPACARIHTKYDDDDDDDNNNNNNNNNKLFAISGDRNVIKKEADKILKYKDLTTEIQRMWNVKTKVYTCNNRGDWDYFKVI